MREDSFDPRSLDLAVGGQAVIEGVMMRCPTAIATAVRTPNGEIVIERRPYKGFAARYRLSKIPLLRGGINLIESMALGMRALMFSAEQAMDEEERAKAKENGRREQMLLWGTMALSFVLALGLFFYLPLILTELTGADSGFAFNAIDGVFRLAVFIGYLLLISKMKDMRILFQYHGAEHKTIHSFENGDDLTADNAARYTTLHPRCGTSFLMFVMLTSIVVFMFLGKPHGFVERIERLAFVPLIGGIAYEIIKFSGKYAESRWIRPFIWPGLTLQRITTKEPSREQLEVAVAALKAVLVAGEEDEKARAYELSDSPSPA